MIKIIILLFSLSAYSFDYEHPRLYFSIGYPYNSLQSNNAEYAKDFLALNIGATMEYQLDEVSSLDITVDANYSPERESMTIAPDNKVITGRASLLASFYAVSYAHKVGNYKSDSLIFSLGPSLGIHTLNYDRFKVNNSNVSAKNRIRIRNYGIRSALKVKSKDLNKFFEIAYYYLIQDKYTIIDDATLDAQAVREDSSVANKASWSLIFNFGYRVF